MCKNKIPLLPLEHSRAKLLLELEKKINTKLQKKIKGSGLKAYRKMLRIHVEVLII